MCPLNGKPAVFSRVMSADKYEFLLKLPIDHHISRPGHCQWRGVGNSYIIGKRIINKASNLYLQPASKYIIHPQLLGTEAFPVRIPKQRTGRHMSKEDHAGLAHIGIKVKNIDASIKFYTEVLGFELTHKRNPVVAMMGLAFKPNIDDLRESPAKYIVTKVMQSFNNANILVVEPNITEHRVFKLTDYAVAYDKADIVVFLTAHDPFKQLKWRDDKVILDFCGIFKK